MDAEKFDKVVLDLLYDELDELTRASAIRHTEQSGRAKALYAELRATREVGALPLVEPPDDLEARILGAEEHARSERPLGQRLGALVSIAASYAMRPQLAMAAVLMLMVGSSLLFLRVKPGAPSSVQVTERGAPESDKESVTVVPVSPPAPEVEAPRAEPMAAAEPQRARAHADAPKPEAEPRAASTTAEKESPLPPSLAPGAAPADDLALAEGDFAPAPTDGLGAAQGNAGPSPAAAGAAKAADESGSGSASGCEADLPRYEAIMAAPNATALATLNAARFAAAQCYARLGRVEAARRAYRTLLTQPEYANPSRRALAVLPEPAGRVAESAHAPEKPAAKAAPAAASRPSAP